MKDGNSIVEARRSFLEAMAGAATGVTLVTSDGLAGRFGVTVSAFASVSADPPMLLACINRKSPAAAAIAANGGFCVNVLTVAQSFLADIFAGRSDRYAPYDFTCADWRRADGGWRLTDSVASFACELDREVAAGSLVYSRRAYSIAQPIL